MMPVERWINPCPSPCPCTTVRMLMLDAGSAHPPPEKPQITQMNADRTAQPLQARRLHHKGGRGLLWQHASRVQGGWVPDSSD